MKKILIFILITLIIINAFNSGCIETEKKPYNEENKIPKELQNSQFKFLFIKIESTYTSINGSLRFHGGDWLTDIWYPWNIENKTLYIEKEIEQENLTAIIFYDYWINHAAYGDLYSDTNHIKLIYDYDLPYFQNFSSPMDIYFHQNFTKEIITNESVSVNLKIFDIEGIKVNNITLYTNDTLTFNSSWTEYYSDYEPNENKWYNATIDYSGIIKFTYYGEWNINNIK